MPSLPVLADYASVASLLISVYVAVRVWGLGRKLSSAAMARENLQRTRDAKAELEQELKAQTVDELQVKLKIRNCLACVRRVQKYIPKLGNEHAKEIVRLSSGLRASKWKMVGWLYAGGYSDDIVSLGWEVASEVELFVDEVNDQLTERTMRGAVR